MKSNWIVILGCGLFVLGIWKLSGPRHIDSVDPSTDTVTQAAAWVGLGVLDWEAGDLENAEMKFKVALGCDPGNPAATSNLAGVLLERARTEPNKEKQREMCLTAAKGYLVVSELRPNDPLVWRNLGAALNNAGMLGEAKVAFERAKELEGG